MDILGSGGEIVLVLLALVGWFVLNRVVLPRLGVSTWMSDACRPALPDETEDTTE